MNQLNPMQMIQMIKGGNPQQLINQIMSNPQMANNPMAKNAMDMFQKGDMQGLKDMANNLAKERGTTIDDVRNSIMQQFGMK